MNKGQHHHNNNNNNNKQKDKNQIQKFLFQKNQRGQYNKGGNRNQQQQQQRSKSETRQNRNPDRQRKRSQSNDRRNNRRDGGSGNKRNNNNNNNRQRSRGKKQQVYSTSESEQDKRKQRGKERNHLYNDSDDEDESDRDSQNSIEASGQKEIESKKRKADTELGDFLGFDDEEGGNEETKVENAGKFAKDEMDKIFKKRNKLTDKDSGVERESKKIDIPDLLNFDEEKKVAPWLSKGTSAIRNTLVRFHNEIIDFCNYILPTETEHKRRETAMDRLTKVINGVFPKAKVLPFGSFATKLYLPHADVDLVLLEPDYNPLTLMNKMAKQLMNMQDKYENINVIRSAKVPLIKLVEKSTQLNFDISFNKLDGVKQINEIQKGLEYYPELKHLIMILKCFLKQRDMNETYTGGIGSFLLFCMVLTFLREVRRDYIQKNNSHEIQKILLSEYLLRFFEMYANFDIAGQQIIVSEGGGIVQKYVKEASFSVLSPQETTHDIGGPCFKAREIFGIFKNRFHFLTNYNFKSGESILKYAISSELL